MRQVRMDELLSLADYEARRATLREQLIAHKKRRRVALGPFMTFLFEDHETVLFQVQEMARAERIVDPAALRFELDTYNALVPPDGGLSATLMIELVDPAERNVMKRRLLGLESALSLRLSTGLVPARFAPEGLLGDEVALVQYLHWTLTEQERAAVLDTAKPASLVSAHPFYAFEAALPLELRASLARDLDPAHSEASAKN